MSFSFSLPRDSSGRNLVAKSDGYKLLCADLERSHGLSFDLNYLGTCWRKRLAAWESLLGPDLRKEVSIPAATGEDLLSAYIQAWNLGPAQQVKEKFGRLAIWPCAETTKTLRLNYAPSRWEANRKLALENWGGPAAAALADMTADHLESQRVPHPDPARAARGATIRLTAHLAKILQLGNPTAEIDALSWTGETYAAVKVNPKDRPEYLSETAASAIVSELQDTIRRMNGAKMVLSANPIDLAYTSDRASWTSCHTWTGGRKESRPYNCGNFAYMADPQVLMLYTYSKLDADGFPLRLWRQMVWTSAAPEWESTAILGREYPQIGGGVKGLPETQHIAARLLVAELLAGESNPKWKFYPTDSRVARTAKNNLTLLPNGGWINQHDSGYYADSDSPCGAVCVGDHRDQLPLSTDNFQQCDYGAAARALPLINIGPTYCPSCGERHITPQQVKGAAVCRVCWSERDTDNSALAAAAADDPDTDPHDDDDDDTDQTEYIRCTRCGHSRLTETSVVYLAHWITGNESEPEQRPFCRTCARGRQALCGDCRQVYTQTVEQWRAIDPINNPGNGSYGRYCRRCCTRYNRWLQSKQLDHYLPEILKCRAALGFPQASLTELETIPSGLVELLNNDAMRRELDRKIAGLPYDKMPPSYLAVYQSVSEINNVPTLIEHYLPFYTLMLQAAVAHQTAADLKAAAAAAAAGSPTFTTPLTAAQRERLRLAAEAVQQVYNHLAASGTSYPTESDDPDAN